MREEESRKRCLTMLLEAASEKWGDDYAESQKASLEDMAEAILEVEASNFRPMEEPLQSTTRLLESLRRMKGHGGG